MNFEELHLSDSVMRGIKEKGFTQPSPIQEQAIPVLIEGKDIIAQAKTGTGKTAAFGIYLLEGLDYEARRPQVLILTPTRELCLQVKDEIAELGKYTGARLSAVYGGASIEMQMREFQHGSQIIVGTPGRVIDHIKRGSLKLETIGLVVIDEADRMLDMGFIDDVEFILSKTSKDRQTLLFSATMPPEIQKLGQKHMHEPIFLSVSKDETPVVTHIKQMVIVLSDPRDKLYALLNYMKGEQIGLAMIFCRTRFGAERLNTILRDRGFKSDALHGDMSQNKREHVMNMFREGKINVLVATDLAARGLDVEGVTHVINYNVPDDFKTYIHRVGRTGRMGHVGTSVTIVMRDEMGTLGQIERAVNVRMQEIKYVPNSSQSRAPTPQLVGVPGADPNAGINVEVPPTPNRLRLPQHKFSARSGSPPPRYGAHPRPHRDERPQHNIFNTKAQNHEATIKMRESKAANVQAEIKARYANPLEPGSALIPIGTEDPNSIYQHVRLNKPDASGGRFERRPARGRGPQSPKDSRRNDSRSRGGKPHQRPSERPRNPGRQHYIYKPR